MPDDTDTSPEAEALARVMWPDFDREAYPATWLGMVYQAQRAINAGWTPPPDRHVEIAREIHDASHEPSRCDADGCYRYDRILAAVRRMDLRRGDQ